MIRRLLSAFALLVGSACAGADAETYTFDLSGIPVEGGFGANFPTLVYDFGVAGEITELAIDITYEAFDPSWRSDLVISLDTDLDFIDIYLEDFGAPSGPGSFSFSLSGPIIPPLVSGDGLVFLTVWDYFADPASPEGIFGAGSSVTVTFVPNATAIPEPSTLAMVGLAGLIATPVGLRRLRRRA